MMSGQPLSIMPVTLLKLYFCFCTLCNPMASMNEIALHGNVKVPS